MPKLIDLLLHAGDHLGMLDQKADGEREQSAGGFVTSNREGLALDHDVVVAQPLSRLFVHLVNMRLSRSL